MDKEKLGLSRRRGACVMHLLCPSSGLETHLPKDWEPAGAPPIWPHAPSGIGWGVAGRSDL